LSPKTSKEASTFLTSSLAFCLSSSDQAPFLLPLHATKKATAVPSLILFSFFYFFSKDRIKVKNSKKRFNVFIKYIQF